MIRIRRNKDNCRRGASVVEMAVVLPVFMMIVMGIIEFGRGMMVGQLVTNSARHGARLAAVDGSTNTEVENAVEQFLIDSVGVSPGDAVITVEVEPGTGNPDPLDNLAVALPKDLVTVIVDVPYDKVGYVAGQWLAGRNLSGRCTMRHE